MGSKIVPDPLPYFRESPPEFQQLVDACFVLPIAHNVELPIHSALLCQHSSFFCNLFKSQEGLSREGLIRVPLPETSLEDAQGWLCIVYMPHGVMNLGAKPYMAVVKLLHKFDMTRILERIDVHLAAMASWNGGHLWVRCLPMSRHFVGVLGCYKHFVPYRIMATQRRLWTSSSSRAPSACPSWPPPAGTMLPRSRGASVRMNRARRRCGHWGRCSCGACWTLSPGGWASPLDPPWSTTPVVVVPQLHGGQPSEDVHRHNASRASTQTGRPSQ